MVQGLFIRHLGLYYPLWLSKLSISLTIYIYRERETLNYNFHYCQGIDIEYLGTNVCGVDFGLKGDIFHMEQALGFWGLELLENI